MLFIVVNNINSRLKYTFDFIFEGTAVSHMLTTDDFTLGDILYYGTGQSDSIAACGLLNESGIKNHRIEVSDFEGVPCLSFDGVADPVATIFYLLTRYEEYNTSAKDEHHRFPYNESCLKKFRWTEKAICDRLARQICEKAGHRREQEAVKLIPTFDIDNVYAYKLKSGIRRKFSVMRDVLKKNKKRISERNSVLEGGKDPYDTYELIKDCVEKNKDARIFWLVGDWGKMDRNVSINHPEHIRLIREMNDVCKIGVHPSYASFGKIDKIRKEKERIERIIGEDVEDSRQHYLRLSLPESYRNLILAGITHDYSMGFAEHCGFRAGTARPFKWFDVERDELTELTIHPFVYMDGSLNEYMGLGPQEAIEKIDQLFQEVEEYGGDFVFIWHNETIGDYQHWKGWKEVLDHSLKLNNEK